MCADAYVNFANGCVLVLNLLFFQTTSSPLAYELILLSVSFVVTHSAYGWHWLLKQYLSCTAVLAHNCFLEHVCFRHLPSVNPVKISICSFPSLESRILHLLLTMWVLWYSFLVSIEKCLVVDNRSCFGSFIFVFVFMQL